MLPLAPNKVKGDKITYHFIKLSSLGCAQPAGWNVYIIVFCLNFNQLWIIRTPTTNPRNFMMSEKIWCHKIKNNKQQCCISYYSFHFGPSLLGILTRPHACYAPAVRDVKRYRARPWIQTVLYQINIASIIRTPGMVHFVNLFCFIMRYLRRYVCRHFPWLIFVKINMYLRTKVPCFVPSFVRTKVQGTKVSVMRIFVSLTSCSEHLRVGGVVVGKQRSSWWKGVTYAGALRRYKLSATPPCPYRGYVSIRATSASRCFSKSCALFPSSDATAKRGSARSKKSRAASWIAR